jgi:hypothetical protein
MHAGRTEQEPAPHGHPGHPTGTLARLLRALCLIALAGSMWLARMSPPRDPATLDLDGSYQQSLGVALSEQLAFGREIVFTSGPLAYFRMSPYVAELYWAKFWLWEVALGGLVAWLAMSRLLRRGHGLDVLLGAGLLIGLPRGMDEWLFLVGLLAADLGLEAFTPRNGERGAWVPRAQALVALTLLAILAAIKVTSLSFAAVVFAVLCLHGAARQGLRVALLWVLTGAVMLLSLWVLLGQSPADLPRSLLSSLSLAAGFDEAMSLPPERPMALGLALALLTLGAVACLLHARLERAPGGPPGGTWIASEAAARAALVLLCLVLAYKAGFTRADHAVTFFAVACFVPQFLIPAASRTRPLLGPALVRAGLALAAVLGLFAVRDPGPHSPGAFATALSHHLRSSLAWLSDPVGVRDYLDSSRARLAAEFELPRIREIVGRSGIGTFTVGDGVLFLNGMNWRPRPVFQSFSVFTEETACANARFLAEDPEARFLLLRTNTIDQRLPGSEDPLALQELLRHWRPRANEGGFLLLERATSGGPIPGAGPRDLIARGTARFGERLALPPGDVPLVLRGRAPRSVWGRFRALLYQSASLHVDLELADGTRTSHRIAPFALEAGVVLRPLLPTNEAWIGLAAGVDPEQVVALSFRSPKPECFGEEIEYSLSGAPELDAPLLEPGRARELVLGAVGRPPQEYDSPHEPQLVGWPGRPTMLFVHSPAALVYAVEPGTLRLRARIEVPPWYAETPEFPGVVVVISAVEQGVERVSARFEIPASREPGAPAGLELDVPVSFTDAGRLRLSLTPLPGGDPALAGVGVGRLQLAR